MFHRRPAALTQLSRETSVSLARLAALEGFSRALLVSVVPLAAMEALGSKEMVARVYLVGAILTVLVTLNIGTLERLLQRRRVVTVGGCFLILAAAMLLHGGTWFFTLGIGMRSAAASIFSVCMSLYVMDYIGKKEFTRNESTRMQHAAVAWLVGPYLGTWMISKELFYLPYIVSAVAAVLMLAYFWWLRLGNDEIIRRAKSPAVNPWKAVVQYSGQRRLRIAYSITLSRSCFWVALFVYGPIYVIESGLPAWAAGGLLSAVSILLFFSPLVRLLSEKIGTRQVILTGLAITAFSLLALGLIGSAKPVGIIFWLLGALGGSMLDVTGNIPFMRSVRPRERLAMTTVFGTWREASELVTPLLVTLTLLVLPFYCFFFFLAIMHFAAVYQASRLPSRL